MHLFKLKYQTENISSLITAAILFLAITLTSFGKVLESSMPGHVLIEIPLLVYVGVLIAKVFSTTFDRLFASVNAGGIFGILLVTAVLVFWMIPRWLDAALSFETVAWAKYISLPLLVGIPLACSWGLLHPVARGVVKIEFLSMLFRLGWLYIISPDRLCNNYLLNDQDLLGKGLLIIGFILSIFWLVPVFFGNLVQENTGHIKI